MYKDIVAVSIDDNEQNLILLEAFADQIELKVVSFIDPIKALDFITTNDVDIIFTDYMMPNLNGLELIEKFRETNNSTPIIMITAAGEDSRISALEVGATDFLNKPLDLPLGLRGSSQVIPFGDNGDRICVTHETHFFWHQNKKKDAQYYHRFIIWDKDWNIKKVSEQFKFMDAMIEFACGLVIKDNNFIITYGYQDNAAYALKMPIQLLDKLKWDIDE